ncbi:MAG TPA: YfhO family protein, partial [Clostridiales bacterium]|nr:YfhO family protein [Clostridiales bacterium]
SSYYMAYIIALFCIIYFLMYYLGQHPLDKDFLKETARCFLYALLAIGLSAFAILPLYFTLKGTYATSGTFPTTPSSYFEFFDYIVNHFSSLEPTIRSSGNTVLPNVYCGVATVMLLVLYFYIPSVPLRQKITRLCAVVFYYFSFNLNILNYIWHGFHYPNDLPYRQSFTYIFLLLFIAADTLKHARELKGKDILTVSVITCAFLVLAEKLGSVNLSDSTILLSLVYVVIYAIILCLFHSKKFKTSSVSALLFVALFSEVTVSDITHFEIDQPVSNYAGLYQEMQQSIDYTKEQEGNQNYRLEITDPTRIMEPCWYGYRGISCFSSMASEKVSNLQYNLGLRSNYVNSYTYHLQTPVYNMMFGIRYIINNNPAENALNETYFTQVGHTTNTEIWKNKYSLPLAYAVDAAAEDWNYYSTNPFTVQSDYFTRATGVKNVFQNIPITDISYQNVMDFGQDLSTGNFVYEKADPDEEASFTANVEIKENKNYYVYVASRGLDTVTVSNQAETVTQAVDASEPFIVDMGNLSAGDRIMVECPCSEDSAAVEIYIVSVNDQQLEKGYAILNDDGAMQVENWSDTNIKGTVTIGEGEDLYTSVNYDAGWTIYVDGKEVSKEDQFKYGDALIGLKMTPGTHTVEFKFRAEGYRLGLLISFFTLLGILLFAVFLPLLRRKKGLSLSVKKEAPLFPGTSGKSRGKRKPAKRKRKASPPPELISKTRAAALQAEKERLEKEKQQENTGQQF